MDKNYIFSTLFATMSCTTVALGTNVYNPQYESFCPIQMADIPSETQNYVLNNGSLSYIYVPQAEEQIDFNILVSFGKKLLDSEARIDEDIQKVINDNFWDML